jgi:hypothetical protein
VKAVLEDVLQTAVNLDEVTGFHGDMKIPVYCIGLTYTGNKKISMFQESLLP